MVGKNKKELEVSEVSENIETRILRNSLFDLLLGSPQNLPRRHVAGRQHDATRSLSAAARERKISPIRSRRAEFGLL